MNIDDTELDPEYHQHSGKGVDTSVRYLLLGIVVIFFFSLFLFGMNRVQTVSNQVVHGPSRVDSEPLPEISDAVDSTEN